MKWTLYVNPEHEQPLYLDYKVFSSGLAWKTLRTNSNPLEHAWRMQPFVASGYALHL